MSDENKRGQKRKKKNYYRTLPKKGRRGHLEPGMKGFLVTCNNKERECIREAYNVLNEYADKIYGPEMCHGDVSDDHDIQDLLEKELQALQKTNKTERRFQQVDTNVKNCLFIETKVIDPCQLVSTILDDIRSTQKQKTRYLLRMIPVSATCKAFVENIKKSVSVVLDEYQDSWRRHVGEDNSSPSFAIIFKARHNNSLSREEVIRAVLQVTKVKKPDWQPDLKDPLLVILVEVVQSVCCLSILKNYFFFRKYNLIELLRSPCLQSLTREECTQGTEKQDTGQNEICVNEKTDMTGIESKQSELETSKDTGHSNDIPILDDTDSFKSPITSKGEKISDV
ncbi:THUMP domain-containing protein 1-like [Limulus polyphemus]|uniref:THUMP domain-containing protein 1-like n=1 Tax=Limulus polyphemus TaxID=6850 RepID=A0ABM1BM39_LIMPO|nr:THUMP domain-containing protein 1-like [Limulus polyphemus]